MPDFNHFFPKLTDIVSVHNLPENLGSVEGEIDQLLNSLYYSDLEIEKSNSGDAGFYRLKIISFDSTGLKIPGTDFVLLLNPSLTGTEDGSVFTASLRYHIPVLHHAKGFQMASFSGEPFAYFEIFLNMAEISADELLEQVINVMMGGADSVLDFVNAFNGLHPDHAISIYPNEDITDTITSLAEQINAIPGIDIFKCLFDNFIDIGTFQDVIDNLLEIFKKWLGVITIEKFGTMLVPSFSSEWNDLKLGVKFPPKWFRQLDEATFDPILTNGEDTPSILRFDVGKLLISSKKGFLFEGESNVDFPLSEILRTGLAIKFTSLRVDLSRVENIPEAAADGRPPDFIGVYVTEAIIALPPRWFEAQDSNLGLFARNLLIGTGGISGTIGLEAIDGVNGAGEMAFILGKKTDDGSPRKGFTIGFSEFQLTFQQNAIIESNIRGSLTIPNFKQCGQEGELRLGIEAFFEQDGDFRIVVDPSQNNSDGLVICFRDIFKIRIDSLEVGKDDSRVYLQLSGALSFEDNAKLSPLLKEDLEVKKFRIYSDGSFELEGGAIPLPDSVELPLGPVNLTISAVHFGAHRQNGREYKYFGFDGGISVDPGGVDARGEGCKYYFTVDDLEPFDDFIQIEGIGINLTIPANATPATATLLLEGYLALRQEEYAGTVKFQLPKAQIAGGASMVYKPQQPAFLVDVSLDLAAPLPLGSTGLGFYGFRALFGFRYLASKEVVGASNWYEYYKIPQPQLGIHPDKFLQPENTENAQTPISIGAGTVLATLSDDGKAFSSRLFLLLSIPNLILLEGKANVMGQRLGLIDANDPPFYAMISYSPGDSVEVGFGANYYMPREGPKAGWIAKLNAEVQAGYFFQDSSAWFVHIGTKNKPVTARLLDTFNGYSYLMLSARGIDAGAGVDFEFKRSYLKGAVKAWVQVYMDVWGKVAFPKRETGGNEKTQFGGGIAVGGHVEGKVLGVGMYIGVDTALSAEAPRPFRVHGSVRLCAGVKIWKKKIQKCFTVEFTWERSQSLNLSPIYALPNAISANDPSPVAAVHMLSGKTYPINYFGGTSSTIDTPFIPIDSYIDLQFEKALLPNLVAGKIGGFSNSAAAHEDVVPPASGTRKVIHRYKISEIEVQIKHNGNWKPYHPFQAIVPEALRDEVANYKIGYWQKTGREYNKIRLLALSPFSYTHLGQPEWYQPEQWGLTPATLFCSEPQRQYVCVPYHRLEYTANQDYTFHEGNLAININDEGSFSVEGHLMLRHPGQITYSFQQLPYHVKLQLMASSAYQVAVRFYAPEYHPETGEIVNQLLVKTVEKTHPELPCEVMYDWEETQLPIIRIEVEPLACDEEKIHQLEMDLIDAIENPTSHNRLLIRLLQAQLIIERSRCCLSRLGKREGEQLLFYRHQLERELEECQEQQEALDQDVAGKCGRRGIIGPQPGQLSTGALIIPNSVSPAQFLACWRAQRAAAANRNRCQEIEEQIAYISYLLDLEGTWTQDGCFTQLGPICWLAEEDYYYNQAIAGQEAIQADYGTMVEAINAEYIPVWRPNSDFRVKVVVSDSVNGGANQNRTAYFGFRTGGPIGHLPLPPESGSNDPESLYSDAPDAPDYRLKYYIDFEKSYPNADGGILYAKPLYYRSPKLLLFFKPRHTHHFFQKWEGLYPGMPGLEYQLDIRIKDPLEGVGDADVPGGLIIDEQTWPLTEYVESNYDEHQLDSLSTELQLMQNLASGSNCLGEQEEIRPPQKYLTITSERLMPSKLYTAVVNNIKINAAPPDEPAEVHRYNFQTSRYGSFEEHIQSINMIDKEGNEQKAFFGLPLPLTNELLQQAWQLLQNPGQQGNAPELEALYPDPFERLLTGLWRVPPMNPPTGTEFNFIRIPPSKGAYALLIRSPESFNDPKMPAEQLQETVRVLYNGQPDTAFRKLFSRDGTQVLLMRGEQWWLLSPDHEIEFRYMLWNGWEYVPVESQTI